MEASHPVLSRTVAPGALRRVLLVDGDMHVLRVMKSSLDRHGYEVDTALTTDVARSLYRESRHDAVIVDADARGRAGDGESLAAALFEDPGDAVPLVVLIGGSRADGEKAGSPPTLERWTKPVSLRYLVARLSEHFGHYEPRARAVG